MKGMTGKYLKVNLSDGNIETCELPEQVARDFIGGYGLAMWALYNEIPAGADPLGPDNAIALFLGPSAGTIMPASSKYLVAAKSPLTGVIGFGISSGGVGQELRAAGYDGVVVKGKSDHPVYIFIDDDHIEIKDAGFLWGKTTWEAEELLRERHADDKLRATLIGPAGEKLCRIANLTNDRNRQIGRSGMGAAFGSKNLKGIAFRGTGGVPVADTEGLWKLASKIHTRCKGPSTEKYRKYGTPVNVLVHNKLGCLPTRNFQQGTFENAANVSGEQMLKTHVKKLTACPSCPIACDHITVAQAGPWKGTAASMDYESLELLGPNCGVDDFDALTKAVELCDTLGVDTISAGGTVSWAMEAYEKGLLTKEDTDGIDLKFGNAEGMVEAVRRMCLREGNLGALIADGAAEAARRLGKDSHKFAIVNKDMEWGAYSMRSLQTATLGFATSVRGACYLRSGSYQVDVKGTVDRYSLDDTRGKVVSDGENLYAVIDSAIWCKFTRGSFSGEEEMAQILNLTTGFDYDVPEMLKAGERIHNQAKLFNIKHGAGRKDDYPPPRAFEEKMYDDVNDGCIIDRGQYDVALTSYYTSRDWDYEGIPSKMKLAELGLDTTLGV